MTTIKLYQHTFPKSKTKHNIPNRNINTRSESKPTKNMGNTIGRSRKAKIMKIDGETFKVKIPTTSNDIVKDYPGYVLLDSQAVKHFGLRAKPLEPNQELKPKKIYFLVELPKIEEKTALPRRVRSSGISTMNAKDRLELLMLSKRSVSDLTLVRQSPNLGLDGPMRVKMRLPKAQLDKLMEESNDRGEVAEKIMSLYMLETQTGDAAEDDGVHRQNRKQRGRRVSFSPVENEEIIVEAAPQKLLSQ